MIISNLLLIFIFWYVHSYFLPTMIITLKKSYIPEYMGTLFFIAQLNVLLYYHYTESGPVAPLGSPATAAPNPPAHRTAPPKDRLAQRADLTRPGGSVPMMGR
jgi:hypothetical protein